MTFARIATRTRTRTRAFALRCAHALLVVVALMACADVIEQPRQFGAEVASAPRGGGSVAANACIEPAEGCACAGNQPPVACAPDAPPAVQSDADGRKLCYEGTRRCEGGRYGACVDVRAYAPPRVSPSALVDQISDHPSCSECDRSCFRVTDAFNPDDGPLGTFATGLSFHSSGAGVTLSANLQAMDAGIPADAGLPDGSIVLAVQAGLSASAVQQSQYRPERADVYLLVDQSLSMAEETLWLYDRFVGGDRYLGSAVPCTDGNQSLAANGISGALRCMVRDPAFGVGMLRDIPFAPYATDSALPAAQQDADARDEIAYRNHANMSVDAAAVRDAMTTFGGVQSSGDPDTAGSQLLALYSVATGRGHFMGLSRRAVPDAVQCPANTAGYPCFRDGSDAIVVLLTDAPMHNGPDAASLPYDYDPNDLATQVGTGTGATTIPSTNDDWSAPYLLSNDAANELAVFLGDTTLLSPNVAAAAVSCGASDAGNDAVFSFTVAPPTSGATSLIQLSADGSSFASALAVFDRPVTPREGLPATSDDNELFESAHALSDVSGRNLSIAGDTTRPADPSADMEADYQGSLFGAACGANSLAPDAVFSFDVSSATAPVEVELSLDMGGDHPVLAVYEDGAGPLPRWPARVAPLLATGNDSALASEVFDIPSGSGNAYVTVTGDTSLLGADYDAVELGGATCNPDSASKDAAFHISVAGTRTLRFDTEGSSFDTVLSLHRRPPLTTAGSTLTWLAADTHQNFNEDAQTAYQTGPVDGLTQVFQGDTTGMSADIGDTFGCGMDGACGDAVYEIQVLQRTTLRLEAAGTGFEPAVVVTRADPAGVSGRYPPIALGKEHGCALSGGEVFCWGADDLGQLGNGGAPGDADAADAVRVNGLGNVLNLCAGRSHTCAVDDVGRVSCWGAGSAGRLGDGNASDAMIPVRAIGLGEGESLGPAVQVACGDAHSCALLGDGRVACWGADADGQLGDGAAGTGRSSPALVSSADRYEQIAAGGAHTCAIRSSDNVVSCWGDGAFGQLGQGASSDSAIPVRALGVLGATHIMTGGQHSCASLSSGRVMCWGRGTEGQLGQGNDRANHYSPIAVRSVDGSGLLANSKGGFAAGRAHTCVTTLEGFIHCFGDNSLRQLGHNASTASEGLPILVFDVLDALTVVAGHDHSCALRADGTLACWGEGAHYKLGNGSTTTPTRPVRAHADATNAIDFGTGRLDGAFTQACHSIAQPPEEGCSYASDVGHTYSFCNEHARTWAGAGQACEAVGMQLVDVDTQGENAFVASGVDDRAWIGVKRTSSDDWSTLENNLNYEDLTGNRVWVTEEVGHDECFWFFCNWVPTRGYFTSAADADLIDSQPWTNSSTWAGSDQPSPDFGHSCVTLDPSAHWQTDSCTDLAEPAGGCGFLSVNCLYGFLGSLAGGLRAVFSQFLGNLLDAITSSLGGVFVAPHFSGGVERDYVCEERDRTTDLTLDPGRYFVTVKGIDDRIPANACAGPYELRITDVGSPGGGFVACDDNGVAETQSSVIETTLTSGDYYLVLKGKRASDEGDYQLSVRDVSAVATNELACDAGSGTGDPARVTFTADPLKRYYALVKGDAPLDRGRYTLNVRDVQNTSSLLACDGSSGPNDPPQLSLDLAAGTYYAVLKGQSSSARGDYRLTLGGAAPVDATYTPPSYADTIDALNAAGVRVATVLSCSGGVACDDARAQAQLLANDTQGVTRSAASAADVPAEVVRSVELLESLDRVYAELLFMPDANPGFVQVAVTPVADPGSLCTPSTTELTDCLPGATASFLVRLQDPALSPVPPSGNAYGAYQFTLRVTGERDGQTRMLRDVPVYVVPTGAPPPGTFSSGGYFQTFDARGCGVATNQRPSWDELYFDADVRPETRVDFNACTADTTAGLSTCDSREVRVLTITAGSASGTPCTAATQATDCPDGYCSPYTGICNYLEGEACAQDADCAGTEAGRCRIGPSAAELGTTCRVRNLHGNPANALGASNLLPYMRIAVDLQSLGDGSRTPSVFFWEAWYRCRNVL